MQTKNENPMECFEHIVDSHHGVYSAQVFAQSFEVAFNNGKLKGISEEDFKILLEGPEHEFYDEVWADLENIEFMDDDGKVWMVYQNEGIFLYPKYMQDKIDWESIN